MVTHRLLAHATVLSNSTRSQLAVYHVVLAYCWVESVVGRDNVFPKGSVLKLEVVTLLLYSGWIKLVTCPEQKWTRTFDLFFGNHVDA